MRNGYKFSKTAIKFIAILVEGGIGAIIAYLTNLPQTQTVVATIAVLTAALNMWKHRK